MSKLNILKYPNKTLKQESKPIKQVSDSIRQLAEEMFETMYDDHGIGLAAPQVGELVRLIVVDVGKSNSDDEDDEKEPDPIALVNPQIIQGIGEMQYDEGCLSCPELIVTVDRFAKIKLGYWDLEGQPQELEADGLKGVCIQHEIDHLNGVLLVDKVSRLERDMYKKKRIKIAKNEEDLDQVL